MGTKRSGVPLTVQQMIEFLDCEVRFELLMELSRGPRNVTTLARCVERETPQVSKALGQLESAGFATQVHRGSKHVFSLTSAIYAERNDAERSFTLRWSYMGDELMLKTITPPPPRVPIH